MASHKFNSAKFKFSPLDFINFSTFNTTLWSTELLRTTYTKGPTNLLCPYLICLIIRALYSCCLQNWLLKPEFSGQLYMFRMLSPASRSWQRKAYFSYSQNPKYSRMPGSSAITQLMLYFRHPVELGFTGFFFNDWEYSTLSELSLFLQSRKTVQVSQVVLLALKMIICLI